MKNYLKSIFLYISLCVSSLSYGGAPNWSVNPSNFANSMTIIGVVDSVFAGSATDLLASFSDTGCRGVVAPTFVAALNKYVYYLVVFANSQDNKNITFRYYNSANDSIIDVYSHLVFENNKAVGSLAGPHYFYKARAEFLNYGFSGMQTITTIDNLLKTIEVKVPLLTPLTALTATFVLSPKATSKIGTVPQASDTTVNNFTNPVTYLVTSAEGDTASWIVTVILGLNNGIWEYANDPNIKVFPNPSSGALFVNDNSHQYNSLSMELYSCLGAFVKRFELTSGLINLGYLPHGIYGYSILGDGKIVSRASLVIE